MSEFSNNKQRLLKERALTYLGGKKCKRCGIDSLHISAYDFHHIDGDKENNISKLTNWEKIKKEFDKHKCVVVCSNCHREIHAYNEKEIIELFEFKEGKK